MSRTRLFVVLAMLCLVDTVIPIPILGLILINVILTRPRWFRDTVEAVYIPR